MLLTLCAGCFSTFLFAQQYVNQVIVVNGGTYEFAPPYTDYVTVAALDPQTSSLTVFDTIRTQSAQDVVVDGKYAWVAAQDSIVKYNINTYSREGAVAVSGVNRMNVYKDLLCVGRQWPASADFIQLYDKNTLEFVYSVSQVSNETYNIFIEDDTAYVAVPGGFLSTTGKVATIDMNNLAFIEEINLDTAGEGIGELYKKDNNLYTVNSQSWSDTYGFISKVNLSDNSAAHTKIDMTFGNGYGLTSVHLLNDTLYGLFNGKIGSYNTNTEEIIDSGFISVNQTIAGAVFDTVNNRFYITESDFYSMGKGYIFALNGDSLGTFNTGISPQAMTIDYRPVIYAENPVADVVTVKNAPDSVILLTNVFSDTSGGTVAKTIAGNSDSAIVIATISNDSLMLQFQPDTAGTAEITLQGSAGGKDAYDKFYVFIDDTDPVVASPIPDITVDEDAGDTLINIAGVFEDTDNSAGIEKSVFYNGNSLVFTPVIHGDHFVIQFQMNQSGEDTVIIAGNSTGKTVYDTVLVTVNPVDDPPLAATALSDINVNENAPDTVIMLTGIFTDIDNADSLITKQVYDISDSALLDAFVSGDSLTLRFVPDTFGTADITVRATSNGKTVDDVFLVTISESSGITITGCNSGIKVFPNPFSREIHILSPEKPVQSIEIYDINGKMLSVYTNTGKNAVVHPEELNKGIYILKIRTEEKTETVRLIKN